MSVMRLLAVRRDALLGAAVWSLLALTLTTSSPARASSAPSVDKPRVPILGQVMVKANHQTDGDSAVVTLHGVRRIPGGTAIYYSIGFTSSGSPSLLPLGNDALGFSRAGGDPTVFSMSMLVDPVGKKAYTALVVDPGSRKYPLSNCLCTDVRAVGDYQSGQAVVLYQVVAALPVPVSFTDVYIAGQVIGHVKVEDGVMTPEVDPSKPILVGMGWPKVDQPAVASALEPAKSVIDLTTSVADLEGTVTTRSTPKQTSVALASDVLFATDSATLSPKAQAVLVRAAADVKAAGGAGTLQVIGYTDNTGSPAHNVDLSRRRAAAVAVAIKPLLPAGVQLQTSGKGEADPVAPNTTPQGRTLNRRVSVVFAPQGGAK